MESGRVAEDGTHEELLGKEDGGYKHLLSYVQSQMKGEDNKEKAANEDSGEVQEVEEVDSKKPQEMNRQTSVKSSESNKVESPKKKPFALTKEEENPKNAGWSALLKYFNVSKMVIFSLQTNHSLFNSCVGRKTFRFWGHRS